MFMCSLNEYLSPEILVAVSVLFLIYLIKYLINGVNRNFPPGPIGLPIIGYLPFLTKKPHEKLQQLSKKYGPVFSVSFGSRQVIVLNNSKLIKEAFSKPEFLGRPPDSVFSLINIQSPFFINGKIWQEQRRFALHSMRDLGLGKSRMQQQIRDEIVHFLKVIEREKGKPIDIRVPLTPSISNNICSLVFGKRYEYDEPVRKLMDDSLEKINKFLNQTSYVLFLPWIYKIPGINKLLKFDCADDIAPIINIVRKEIEIHKKTLDPTNVRDYIDSYLVEMQSRSPEESDIFTEELLIGAVQSLFRAGSETVRTTIEWCMCIMAIHPELQTQIQKEIEDVIGTERLPEFADQKDLILTQSVLTEIQRWQSIVPLNLLRYTLEDTTVAGYNVPKGTHVLANFWAAHRDPECWKSPDDFISDRFLTSDRKFFLKSDNYVVFSSGKRSCPGEGLAVMEIFLYFTSILQKFQVTFPIGEELEFEGELGITYHLKPHKLCLTPRH